ncbi:MAG: glycoside hydrolase family 99-like domain-containing protein [Methylococcales bacterium]|nr:glycoside hydrolase family 99-like domain-containing protein [Methylococcales bacterium]
MTPQLNNDEQRQVRAIAFYLPQYHPIPENDEWWGKGFTEWTNVTKAKPVFPGHYQPHLPADHGFYDLRLPEVREQQAVLAKEYGIHGFCYYHYWFNGRRILERPFNEVLASGKPDFPFCLCWANENWTRTWSGGTEDVLLNQNYSHEDDLEHIRSLIPAFRDERYIRIDGKPLFLVYRTELLPNPARTAAIWREEAIKQGIGDLYLVRVESFINNIAPQTIGFDAAVEFAPDWDYMRLKLFNFDILRKLAKIGLFSKVLTDNQIIDYDTLASCMMRKAKPGYIRFQGVTPSWDNSARRKKANIIINSTPDKYEEWLAYTIHKASICVTSSPKLVFLNAWNEWAEGNHLEPDQKWGHAYLQATLNAITYPDRVRNVIRRTPNPLNLGVYLKHVFNSYLGWRFKRE